MSYIITFGPKNKKKSTWKGRGGKTAFFRSKASAEKVIAEEKRGLFSSYSKGWKWKAIKR